MRGRDFNALGSLSGHASAMIGSIRNNLRRKNSEYFKSSKEKSKYKKAIFDKKSTPEQLKTIREKLQKENRKRAIVGIIYFVISFVIIMVLVNIIKF